GTREGLSELFPGGPHIASELRSVSMRGDSAESFVEFFRRYFGPTLKAFEALSPADQPKLQKDLVAEVNRFNRSGDDTVLIRSEYLETVITKP
ncbi:MAG TPA: SAM-dependent methyltransferase, partial [Thermoplasmata archaeon]|nr:SAM-dependent methyltransferase [Thermoplasmata archaeon]